MQVNIQAVVEELKNIKIENVIFEAIMNAMQADATKIQLKIYAPSLQENDKTPYIEKLEVIDNGEGFNEKNLESFNNYRSDFKKHLGCKGIGRFLYLKLFDIVKIRSKNIEAEFNLNGLKHKKLNENIQNTEISFLSPKEDIFIDLEKICDRIKEHFLAYFKMENKLIQIEIYKDGANVATIKSTDIPNFKTRKYIVKKYDFTISYVFGDKNLKNEIFYAANSRIVIKNSNLKNNEKFNLSKGINLFFILESVYFDNNVNNERNELEIYHKKQNDTLEFHDLNWEEIYEELKRQIKEIYIENGLDIDGIIQKNKKEAIETYPYLGAYFENRDELNCDEMIEKAQKEFDDEKEFVRDRQNSTKKDYEIKLSRVTQAELAEYIFDRNKTIEKLKKCIKNNTIEEEVHNLFMPKKTSDNTKNYKSNNIWLFDDRFMSYDKIFSDKKFKEIFPELYDKLERPDILSIVSNTYDKEKITDILLIELKRPDTHITPAIAEEQLLKYGRYINDTNKINKIRIWTYAFLQFNQDTLDNLKDKSYNQIFTADKYPICYRYYEAPNIIVNFMDYNSLVRDAENRNKLFLDILKGKYLNINNINTNG